MMDKQESRRSRIRGSEESVSGRLVTLADFVSCLAKSNVRGPLHFTEPNLQSGGVFVARGGQWEVFTDRASIMDGIIIKRVNTAPNRS